MNGTSDLDISRILSSLYRRKALIVCAFLVVSLLTAYTAVILPNIYQSSSLVLVSPQKVPTSFVTSTVTRDLSERMQSIIQEILSRTQLEKIVREFDLYSAGKNLNLDERIQKLHKAIKVESPRYNVLRLSYESMSPEKAQQVTSRIASLFIEQNRQIRQQEAIGTKSFIDTEAERLRKELEEQETVVNHYKATHRYELPDQLDANLRTLEQLRRELEGSNLRLAALQERKGILQKQSVESDIIGADPLGGSFAITAGGRPQNFHLKKKELEGLLQKYSDKHPDVVRLKKEIESLNVEGESTLSDGSANSPSSLGANPLKKVLVTQITDIDSEIQALRLQNERIRGQAAVLQARIDTTSIRTIELSKISRNYEITLKKFQDLLAKSLDSELAENMEKTQKSEQFQILDPAYVPLVPVSPNRRMIILMGLLVGLGVGFGLALVWENLIDTSFKGGDEVKAYVNFPVLATIPALLTRGSVMEQRRSQSLMLLASIGVLTIGLVCVRTLVPTFF
jgi:polysaccharide chain length determinant protein (PEP-CTERM system associated)